MNELTRLHKQLEFIHEIDKLKYILRKTKLFNSDRAENDVEHSWHLTMIALVLSEHANHPINLVRVMKMLLIHDVVEIDAGDVFFYDKTQSHDNRPEEFAAAKRIFGLLPQDQATELETLWLEFEACQTHDAMFAKAIDRLEPLLQNYSNQGGTWIEYDVKYQEVLESKLIMKDISTPLWEYTKDLLSKAVEQGILKN